MDETSEYELRQAMTRGYCASENEEKELDATLMEQGFLERLVDEHWTYIKGLLTAHDEPEDVQIMIEYHYKASFRHGWKHHKEYEQAKIQNNILQPMPLGTLFENDESKKHV